MGNAIEADEEQLKSLHLNEAQLRSLYKKFNQLDTDKSGKLEPKEFLDIPELANNPLVKRLIDVLDTNHDGSISFLEFVAGLSQLSSQAGSEQKLKFAFRVYDINNDGFISNGELFQVLKMMVGTNLNDQQIQQLVDRTMIKADLDMDGKLSFQEFRKMINQSEVKLKLTVKI